nr:immunoglobulin heavy chain junction region [Mus musculus]
CASEIRNDYYAMDYW